MHLHFQQAHKHIHARVKAEKHKEVTALWVHTCVCVVKRGKRALMWARTFAAVVTSRGQRESLQFLLSSSSPMTRPQQRAQTNTAIWFLVASSSSFFSSFCFCNFSSCRTHHGEMLKVRVHAECSHQTSEIIPFSPCRLCEICFPPFFCPRVPHTSIPVWLDLKGQLEGWQPSLTWEGWASEGRSGMERDESRKLQMRWSRKRVVLKIYKGLTASVSVRKAG